jgi:hypothetical protein
MSLSANPPSVLALQVCTGVMLYGYPVIKKLCGGLQVRRVPGTLLPSTAKLFRGFL